MTAADILFHWRKVAPVIGNKPSAWIAMLTICEAGEAGIPGYALRQRLREQGVVSGATPTLRRWEAAGLLTTSLTDPSPHGGSPGNVYHATPKLFAFLRISAPGKVACAACDRGDFQLGHADECPKAH